MLTPDKSHNGVNHESVQPKDGPKHAMKESSCDAPGYTGHLLVPMFRVVW